MEILKEHRLFRNQLIVATIIFFGVGWFIPEILVYGIILGLLALCNIFIYRQNVKDYNLLNGK